MLISLDHVLGADEVRQFRSALDSAPWQSGQQTAGTLARHVKRNQQLAVDDPVAQRLGEHLLRRLGTLPGFVSAALPRRILPPRFNRYADAGTYGTHVDSALMDIPGTRETLRADLSATLFLSEPEDYEGGELEIETPFGAQAVKLAAGDLVIYPSSSLHRVTPVTAGARVAAFFWIESLVPDDGARALLYDLDQAIQGLTAQVPSDDPHLLRLTGTYHNLLRRWART